MFFLNAGTLHSPSTVSGRHLPVSFRFRPFHRLWLILYFLFLNLYIFLDKIICMRYNAIVMGEHGSPMNYLEGNDLCEKDII